MIDRDDECYFCKNLAVDWKRCLADVEPSYDDGVPQMIGVWREVPLCEEHLEEQNENA